MIELALYVGLMTSHIDGGQWNEQNQLIAIEAESIVIGRMKNSLWNESYILAHNHRFNDWSGVLLGAATGYDYDCIVDKCANDEIGSDDVMPVIAPYIHWKDVHVSLQITALNISYRFGR